MFCEEKIIRVYIGQNEYDDFPGDNAFLDCYHDLAYHVTEGNRIVLESEKWAITLDVNGVSKEPRSSLCERPREWLRDTVEIIEPDEPPYVHFENTLFIGERLQEVTKTEDGFLCRFDHFVLKVIPYELGMMDKYLSREDHWSYNFVLGCDRHLTRKCGCGGEGEILLDFVSDYIVRCKKCKKSTWANMELKMAIDDWNDGELHCVLDNITIE